MTYFILKIYVLSAIKIPSELTTLKQNAIVSVQCTRALLNDVRAAILAQTNILESRVIIKQETTVNQDDNDIIDLSVDQYVKFAECCRAKLENNELLEAELAEILK